MTRISLWLLSTVSVVVLLFGYHTSTSGALATSTLPSAVSGTTAGTPYRSSTSSSSGSTGSSTAKTVTGDVAQTQWGPVQVQLGVSGGRITDVAVVRYPHGNGTDQEINSYALPILVQETRAAQSAQIDMVSGATVTSDGYLRSLQSALDRAGL